MHKLRDFFKEDKYFPFLDDGKEHKEIRKARLSGLLNIL